MKIVKIENYIINCEQIKYAKVYCFSRSYYLAVYMIGDTDRLNPAIVIEYNSEDGANNALNQIFNEITK